MVCCSLIQGVLICSGSLKLLVFVVLFCWLVSIGFKWCQVVLIGVR